MAEEILGWVVRRLRVFLLGCSLEYWSSGMLVSIGMGVMLLLSIDILSCCVADIVGNKFLKEIGSAKAAENVLLPEIVKFETL